MAIFREATVSDLDICIEIIDANERLFDPQAHSAGPVHVEEIINGYFTEVFSFLLIKDEKPIAFVNSQGDDVRKTFYTDIYVLPEHDAWQDALSEAERIIDSRHSDWRAIFSVNGKDRKTKEVLERNGYSFLRKYWGMEAPFEFAPNLTIPDEIELRKIDFEKELPIWHQAYQDAFSNHFGFVPRSYEKWSELARAASSTDKEGTFLMFKGQTCIGFVESSTELEHENSGYINLIGVIKAEQGHGYGSILIEKAKAYAYAKGLRKIGLNVDTGNTSSALHLYEKHGFKANFSYEQFCKTDKEPK